MERMSEAYECVGAAEFPKYRGGIAVNMMPFVYGDRDSIPRELHGYLPIVDRCARLERGKVAYLTIDESAVTAGRSQRRAGAHTDGTRTTAWGGGPWGGKATDGGIYMASSDGSCRVWDAIVPGESVSDHGAVSGLRAEDAERMRGGALYWMTDRTPHESLPVERDTLRQFVRVVSNKVGAWWARHSTANPLGVMPDCAILTWSKF